MQVYGTREIKPMIKILELNQKEIMEIFRSMGNIKLALHPEYISEANLNFETARDALQILEYNTRAMAEDPEILMPTILELVLYLIDLNSLPEAITQEIRDQIPAFLGL